MIPSSCHGDLREPLMLSLGSQESFQVVRGFSGFLLSWCRRLGPHLVLRGESPWVSRVETGNLGFLSSCDGDLKPACVASGKSSLHSSCEGPLGIPLQSVRGIGPHLELRLEPQGASPVLTWISGFLWSFNRGVRPRLMWRHGNLPLEISKRCQASCRGNTGFWGFFSRCHPAVTPPFMF